MNLRSLAGHTVDLDRLPEIPLVLDVGSRNFDFTLSIKRERPHARVIALDPDPIIPHPIHLWNVTFMPVALVHDDRQTSRYASYSTGEGNMLTDLESYYDAKMLNVPCINILKLMRLFGISGWDLVKLDCEGSEFDILANWPGPIADQISVEFHDGHPQLEGDHRIERGKYFVNLWSHLAGYRVVQHEIFKQGDWYGHWDTLLTL